MHGFPSRDGGIGRRSGFKIRRRKVWGFESPSRHQDTLAIQLVLVYITRINDLRRREVPFFILGGVFFAVFAARRNLFSQ